jgi:preprotein translocase subunit SecA
MDLLDEYSEKLVEKHYEAGDIDGLQDEVRSQLLVDLQITPEKFQELGHDGVRTEIVKAAAEFYRRKEERLGSELIAKIEKMVVLQVIDEKWKDHLREMDDLKEGIHLRAYGQKDPLVEYKTEGFRMFMELLDLINTEIITTVFRLFPAQAQPVPLRGPSRLPQQVRLTHETTTGMGFQGNREPVQGAGGPQEPAAAKAGKPQPMQVGPKVGRNDPCPCGSGKKYKHCHGK